MKSLKQFLEEALTHPYEFSKQSDSRLGNSDRYHSYTFKDHKDRPFLVDVYHSPDNQKKAEVAFEDRYGSMGKTGESGTHAVRVFSTVKAIMKKHAEDHPHLNSYEFTAIKPGHNKEDSKARLYKTLANAYGGTKTGEDEFFHKFEVPIKKEKK